MTWLIAYLVGYLACCVLFYRDSGQQPVISKHNRWILKVSLLWPIWAFLIVSEKVERWWWKRKRGR